MLKSTTINVCFIKINGLWVWSGCFNSYRQKSNRTLCIISANTLLKSAPLPTSYTYNWRRDKLVIMSWNEQWRWVDWHAGAGVALLLLALCRLRLYPTGLKNSKMKTVTATTDRHITNIITHTAGLYGSATHTNTHMQIADKVGEVSLSSVMYNFINGNLSVTTELWTKKLCPETKSSPQNS